MDVQKKSFDLSKTKKLFQQIAMSDATGDVVARPWKSEASALCDVRFLSSRYPPGNYHIPSHTTFENDVSFPKGGIF